MKNWTKRLKDRMYELGITHEMLATKMGITRGAVTHYLCGRRIPPLKQFQKLATILKTNPSWILYGKKDVKLVNDENHNKSTGQGNEETIKKIPIVPWESIIDFHSGVKNIALSSTEYLKNLYTDSNKDYFALKVRGDSMTSQDQRGFYENDLLIIEPKRRANINDYVIAIIPEAKEAVFKQLVIDNSVQYLMPLNPRYPLLKIGPNIKIVGIVVGSYSFFTS